jgi:hypothetical protein
MHEDNTHQQLERTEAITRDAAWEDAFLAQLTHDLADSVAAFAKKRASWLLGKTKRKDDYLWRELYQDAITDTWTGEVSWDPQKAPLDLHLKRVIRSRTTMAMRHLTLFPRVAANAPKLELEHEMSDAMAATHASERCGDLRSYVDEVVEALYLLAAHDDEVTQVLDCYAQGYIDRRDVMSLTGMKASTHHNAVRRLLRLVDRLPHDLRNEAIRAMA